MKRALFRFPVRLALAVSLAAFAQAGLAQSKIVEQFGKDIDASIERQYASRAWSAPRERLLH